MRVLKQGIGFCCFMVEFIPAKGHSAEGGSGRKALQ
jgi:hypothetical protein